MSLYDTAKELRAERCKLADEAQRIHDTARDEGRDLDAVERERWDTIHARVDELREKIDSAEKALVDHEARAKQLQEERDWMNASRRPELEQATPANSRRQSDDAELEARAFESYIRLGIEGHGGDAELRQAMHARYSTPTASSLSELRAQSAETDSTGGYTVPESFMTRLDVAMVEYGGMLEAAEVIDTATGADLPLPTTDDSSNVGALLGENTQETTTTDVTFGATTLQAFLYTSDFIKVSYQLMQDGAFDIEGLIARLAGERLGRILNTHATTGDGSSKPNGLVTASTSGKTSAANTAATWSELLDLKHSVDPAYRRRNGAWMFADSTLKAVKQLEDSAGQPLWHANPAVGAPDTLDGDPIFINQDVAAYGSNAKPILYGDFSGYKIRRVRPITMLRLTERFADYLQVGFLAFMRWDGDLVSGGTPYKHLTMPA